MKRKSLKAKHQAQRKMTGARVSECRKRKGLLQVDLAASLGKDPSIISKIERGEVGLAPADAKIIAGELGVSVAYLLYLTDEVSPWNEGGAKDAEDSVSAKYEQNKDREITPEQAIENYQLILDEPNLFLKLRGTSLTVEDQADIADYIRFVRERERQHEERERGSNGESS